MKRICLLLAMLVGSLNSIHGQFINGKQLHDEWISWSKNQNATSTAYDQFPAGAFSGYCIGVIDYAIATKSITVPPNVTISQVITIVGRYLDNHPELWQYFGVGTVFDALVQVFPPEKNKTQ